MSLFNALNVSITMILWLSNARVKCVCCSWSQPHAFSWLYYVIYAGEHGEKNFYKPLPRSAVFLARPPTQKLNFFGWSRIFLPGENVFCQDNVIGKGCGSHVNNNNDYNSYKNTDIENKLLISNSLCFSPYL